MIPPPTHKPERGVYIWDRKGKKLIARLNEMIDAKYESPAAKKVRNPLATFFLCLCYYLFLCDLGNIQNKRVQMACSIVFHSMHLLDSHVV